MPRRRSFISFCPRSLSVSPCLFLHVLRSPFLPPLWLPAPSWCRATREHERVANFRKFSPRLDPYARATSSLMPFPARLVPGQTGPRLRRISKFHGWLPASPAGEGGTISFERNTGETRVRELPEGPRKDGQDAGPSIYRKGSSARWGRLGREGKKEGKEASSPAPRTTGNPIIIIIPGESIVALDRIGSIWRSSRIGTRYNDVYRRWVASPRTGPRSSGVQRVQVRLVPGLVAAQHSQHK